MRKLLVVDDDPAVLGFVAQVAESMDYQVVRAPDEIEALIAYGGNPDVDALVADVRMPGVNGYQLATALREKRPDMPILFISGYADDTEARAEMRLEEGVQFLAKPFSPAQLGARLLLLLAALPET